MKKFELFKSFIEKVTGKPLEEQQPVALSGQEVVEALWPLNDVFRPNLHQISSLPYRAKFELDADAAIERFVLHHDDWTDLPPPVWRVLLERHEQALTMSIVNERAGNGVLIPIPAGFPVAKRMGAAMLFLMHGMELPFPVRDRSEGGSVDTPDPASLLRQ